MAKQPPQRITPDQDPSEAVERVVGTRSVETEPGDVVIRRETAGRLTTEPTVTTWRYALLVEGASQDVRHFARYDFAAIEGEQLAAKMRARLLYLEDDTGTLLMDYRRPQ